MQSRSGGMTQSACVTPTPCDASADAPEDDKGRRLLRIIRRGTGAVVTWRRAQMVLLSAQGMPVAKIAEVTFTSADRVRDVIHNFTADGFEALYPKTRPAQHVHPARAARDPGRHRTTPATRSRAA